MGYLSCVVKRTCRLIKLSAKLLSPQIEALFKNDNFIFAISISLLKILNPIFSGEILTNSQFSKLLSVQLSERRPKIFPINVYIYICVQFCIGIIFTRVGQLPELVLSLLIKI